MGCGDVGRKTGLNESEPEGKLTANIVTLTTTLRLSSDVIVWYAAVK